MLTKYEQKKLHELLDYAFYVKTKGHDLLVSYDANCDTASATFWENGWSLYKNITRYWYVYKPSHILSAIKKVMKKISTTAEAGKE
jgi:hypothetical protein